LAAWAQRPRLERARTSSVRIAYFFMESSWTPL
jgi:hypothetical protein